MADKRDAPLDDLEPQAETPLADTVVERIPSTAGAISALASANAPHIFFDGVPFAGYFNGNGDITLTASRHIAVVDGHGVVADRVVTAVLHAPIETLRTLKHLIGKVEEMAEQQLAAAVHAATGGTPPSGSVN